MPTKKLPFVTLLDLTGTFLFAVEGAVAAIHANLGLLGVQVIAFCTALGGVIIRDLLIIPAPPNALKDWRYAALAFAGGALTFFLYSPLHTIPATTLPLLDAAALSLFAAAGTEKSLACKIQPFIAILIGGITALGGGVLRDLLLGHAPAMLHADIYATAALVGGAILVTVRRLGGSARISALCGFAACFLLRLLALHLNLPTAAP
jgi:uncharacterized membrane protein YeiH